ncbi:MAG: hypothetical protein ABSC63_02455 [Candidatus Binataceae bacterium]|jgi:hypothetical protein
MEVIDDNCTDRRSHHRDFHSYDRIDHYAADISEFYSPRYVVFFVAKDAWQTAANDESSPNEDLESTFRVLSNKWRNETATSSSKSQILSNPSYLSIIEMGEPVLPFIFEEMADTPDFWFRALQQITTVNPVLPNSSFSQAVSAWLDWGRKHGYVPGGETHKD